jgi:xanthine/CO dehydrogenase XdhC/CoxF family maturation factor
MSNTYSSCAGNGGGYGFPPPNSGSGFCVFLLFKLAPTVCVCCNACVAVLCSSIGWPPAVRVLAIVGMLAPEAVAVLFISRDSEEEVELEPALSWEVLRWASCFSLLVCDQVRVASNSARSMSRSTMSILPVDLVWVIEGVLAQVRRLS